MFVFFLIANSVLKLEDGVTNQQHHETEECPKRLVICPMNCLVS
jgi:hypothetical protein